MGEAEQLRSIIDLRRKSRPDRTAKLGDAVKGFVDGRVSPRQAMFSMVAGAWNQLLPAELRSRCKIVDISGGRLKVQVDSPPYMYELRLCSSQLLEELQNRCPQAKLKKIEFSISG